MGAPTHVEKAAAKVKAMSRALRMAIEDLATARSNVGPVEERELTSREWEAIQEANLAIGSIPRPT